MGKVVKQADEVIVIQKAVQDDFIQIKSNSLVHTALTLFTWNSRKALEAIVFFKEPSEPGGKAVPLFRLPLSCKMGSLNVELWYHLGSYSSVLHYVVQLLVMCCVYQAF